MMMLRFLVVACALTALLAGCATTADTSSALPRSTMPPDADAPSRDQSDAASPSNVPGALQAP